MKPDPQDLSAPGEHIFRLIRTLRDQPVIRMSLLLPP
jgi:hypothetical protein